MKHAGVLVATALLLLSLSMFNSAFGQSTQTSCTVKLNSFSLQVTYPSEVLPGDNFTVNVQGNPAEYAVYLQSLTVSIYYADASGLHQVATENLVVSTTPNAYNNYLSYGYSGSFSKNFTVNVPDNAPRTSLVALFYETVLPKYQAWTGPTYQGYPYYPYYPYYPSSILPILHTPYYPYYPSYAPYVSPAFYPYSSYSYSSDQAIAPLSYIKANTPESVTLQSENEMLQQQLDQAQSQSQQLQTKVSQQNATINQLSQQLVGINGTVEAYQMLALGLGVLAMILIAFTVNQRRGNKISAQIVETKAT